MAGIAFQIVMHQGGWVSEGTARETPPRTVSQQNEPSRDRPGWLRLMLPLAVIGALVVIGRSVEVEQYMVAAREWVYSLGPWGPAAYVLLYVVATLLFLPGTPFTVLAALLFGTGVGFVVMMIATTLAAAIAFLIARYAAKAAVEARLGHTDTFRRLRTLIEEDGRYIIPTIRFLPIFPFSFNNYALGLTNISFWSYMLWSELVFVIMNAVLVLAASALYRALILGETSWWLIGGSTVAGILVLVLGRWAHRVAAGRSAEGTGARRAEDRLQSP